VWSFTVGDRALRSGLAAPVALSNRCPAASLTLCGREAGPTSATATLCVQAAIVADRNGSGAAKDWRFLGPDGDWDRALVSFRLATEVARDFVLPLVLTYLPLAACGKGDLEEADASIHRATGVLADMPWPKALPRRVLVSRVSAAVPTMGRGSQGGDA